MCIKNILHFKVTLNFIKLIKIIDEQLNNNQILSLSISSSQDILYIQYYLLCVHFIIIILVLSLL